MNTSVNPASPTPVQLDFDVEQVRSEAVESSAALDTLLARCQDAPLVGIDTEFVRERTYHARPGLVQIACADTVYLLDPLSIDDLRPLATLLAPARPLKVLHAAGEDLPLLARMGHCTVRGVFDTQLAAAFCGLGMSAGYHRLVASVFGLDLPKDQTRSDWLARPLSTAQLRYAALDAALLPPLHGYLQALLAQRDLEDWNAEENSRLASAALADIDADDAFRRIKGHERLGAVEQHRLRALARWRELTAEQQDIPRTFIVRDGALLDLARQPRLDLEALRSDGQMHPRALRVHGQALLAVHAEASQAAGRSPAVLACPLERRLADGPGRRLRSALLERAEELGLAPELLASRRDVETLLLAYRDAGEDVERMRWPAALSAWRDSAIGTRVRDTLTGAAGDAGKPG